MGEVARNGRRGKPRQAVGFFPEISGTGPEAACLSARLWGYHAVRMDDHVKQLLLLGREHYQKRELDKAEYLLRQVVATTDRFADVFDMLGVISHSKGDFAQAERYFEKAVSLNPNYTEAQLNLMVTYNDLGKYEAARQVYGQIRHRGSGGPAKADPFAKGKIANMHADISQAYLDAGMTPEAVFELERAVALCPGFADLRTKLATLYRDTSQPERAREQLEAARDSNPNYGQARLLLGVMHLSAGEHELAIAEFDAVLLRDGDNKNALMYRKLAEAQRARSERPDA
jgi:tetratricopeptide (TPR) repeat protein